MPETIMRAAILALLLVARIHKCLCAEKKFCASPPEIQGATISDLGDDHHQQGKVITYSCNFGYLTEGTGESSECVRSQNGRELAWTQPGITCVPRSCGFPGFVQHGTRNGSRFTYPNSVSFECEEGYALVGNKQRFCQTNGQWSGRLPTCKRITCPEPQSLENGRTVFSSLEFGSELNYECDKGYILSTRETRFCFVDGVWSGDEPECLDAHCDIPDPPEFGSRELVGNEAKVGSIILFTCDEGKELVGSRNTKCLKTREWTFPPPKCLDPCKIPLIPNGEIGIYQRRYQRVIYRKLPIGDLVEDDKELSFKCSKKFEHSRSGATEIKVTCRHGQWSHELQCNPASCPSIPPPVPNARVSSISTEHGGTVVYLCNRNFIKVRTGAVTCVHGEWTGPTPACKNTNCSREDLNLPGLLKEEKSSFASGEYYTPNCAKGYELSRPGNASLKCQNGQWTGHLTPCKGATCRNPPPSTEHGYATVLHQADHGSYAHYECNPPHFLAEAGTIQCLLGEWKGLSPMCKDSRCYQKDLKFNRGIVLIRNDVTHSGRQAAIECEEGFELKYLAPKCMNGIWNEQQVSPCARKSCLIPSVNYGQITTRRKSEPTWSWKRWRYEISFIHTAVKIGSIFQNRTEYFVICNPGFSFQGIANANHVATECNKGYWNPEPACLRPGAIFKPSTRRPTCTTSVIPHVEVIDEIGQGEKNHENDLPITIPSTIPISELTVPEVPGITTTSSPEIDEGTCSCTYNLNDPNVQAFSEDKLLSFGSKVTEGSTVRFYCTLYKIWKLMGLNEVVCRNCRSWHSSEFPTCVEPAAGDVIIIWLQKENTLNVLPTGELSAIPEANLTIMCSVLNGTDYALWTVIPQKANLQVNYDAIDLEGRYILISTIQIISIDRSHEGIYECSGGPRGPRRIHITLPPMLDSIEFCDAIAIDNSILVQYEDQMEIHTRAFFRCRNPDQEMHGVNTTTCLPNGNWENEPPKCQSRIANNSASLEGNAKDSIDKCPALEETDNLRISYAENRRVGSIATFHCLEPFVRKGSSYIVCLRNGRWSNPPSACTSKPDTNKECPALEETDNLRISYTENRKVGSKATFHCFSPFVRKGPSQTACLRNGSWSNPPSVCTTPLCSVEDLFSDMPEGVVPNVDDIFNETMPYASVVRIGCDSPNLILVGGRTVTCGYAGKWEVGRGRCVPGCEPIEKPKESELIIEPDKEFYRFGEFTMFSCPDGYELSSEVERVMCLRSGWSEEVVPVCRKL